jgi:hypothetical protein
MQSFVVIAAVAIIVIVAAVGAWWYSRQRRRARLRQQFGPEYERAVDHYGDSAEADKALSARAQRVEQLHIRPLSPERSSRYADDWRLVQERFVDDPERAIGQADHLVIEVMRARGYPMVDFEQRAADISVDHPRVVEHYRIAHALASQTERGQASTEEMRQAMVHYRTLFEELIQIQTPMEVRR